MQIKHSPTCQVDLHGIELFFCTHSHTSDHLHPPVSTMPRGILLTSNLPQLQNLIKRDPEAYKEEFLQQWNHYNTIRQIFHLNPEEQANHFRELTSFIAQVPTLLPKKPTHMYLMIVISWLNVIQKKRQNSQRKYPPCLWTTTQSCPQIPAGPWSRTWLC